MRSGLRIEHVQVLGKLEVRLFPLLQLDLLHEVLEDTVNVRIAMIDLDLQLNC